MGQLSEAVLPEKADRQTGSIGGKAQNIKPGIGVQPAFLPVNDMAAGQLLQGVQKIVFLIRGRFRSHAAEQGGHGAVLIGIASSLGPQYNRGVSHPADVVAVGQQGVQGCCIGKSGIFACGGVGTLLVVIGTEGRGVEGHQRGTSFLCASHPLDAGMKLGQGTTAAGDQTENIRFAGVVSAVIVALPSLLDDGVLRSRAALIPEGQIAALHQVLPVFLQDGTVCGPGGVPVLKKAYDGPGSRGIRIPQET